MIKTDDLNPRAIRRIKTENYKAQPKIQGVTLLKLNYISSEDGYFVELARLGKEKSLKSMPPFKVEQISYSSLDPKSVKAWHIHYRQDDIWFIPPNNKVLIGLHDLRKSSPTKDVTQRIILGNHQSNLLLIPKGVAHGCANLSNSQASLIYFTNRKFNSKKPDEQRLPWDYLGKGFWKINFG